MSHSISLTLRMLSDWHIGAGTGQYGRLSRQVLKDEKHGLPFVPAKSLNGVWRDGCEIAARALDTNTGTNSESRTGRGTGRDGGSGNSGNGSGSDSGSGSGSGSGGGGGASASSGGDSSGGGGARGGDGIWRSWVDYLFGYQPTFLSAEAGDAPAVAARHPRPAALRYLGPLRLSGELGQAIAGNRRLLDAVTFVKPGVAHDPVTGAAREDMLRFDEMARGGVTLEGTAELPEGLTEEQLGCARALLWAGARLVEGIGAKRRRGSGRCRLDLGGTGLPPSGDDLARWTANPVPPPQPEGPPQPDSAGKRAAGEGWEHVVLRMTLETPLLAHHRTVGNLVESRDHVPGWILLGPVLKRLNSSAAAAAARCGDLVVTPATPQVDGARGRPVPRVFERDKEDRSIHNRAAEASPQDRAFKRVRKGYVSVAPNVAVETPEFVLRMHNTIEDESQRPAQALGGVYVYQAIKPGTVLVAEVRVRRGILDAGWWTNLSGQWRLGRSRKDDYGLVSVTTELVDPTSEATPIRAGDRLCVWLLSDVLVRDSRLAPSDDPHDFAELLQKTFAEAGADGVKLEPVLQERGRIPTSYEIARTDSWHRGWRLPRPVLLGFAAGGCLTFAVKAGHIGADVLAEVERSGIGERRGEGFGQVRINDPLLVNKVPTGGGRQPVEQARAAARRLATNDPGHAGARLIETAAWRAEIWRLAEERAASPNEVLGSIVGLSATRLNALRRLFDHLGEEPEVLEARIVRLTKRWDAPRITAAIRTLLARQDVWETLQFEDQYRLCLTVDGPDVLPRELRPEALRSLLTACLAAHTRQKAHTQQEAHTRQEAQEERT
ncbi:RAMP superfamily CRISPR-associated protein [Actinomadura terrae]|uniref:RAMP superfamily CRISPR-associated protein n=1 Tax=Actinomadura terrae TaxID=604353 RepID=UPI001FA7EEDD|nr:RAMP superfamily CRISPR-associated protein [Actinomadura terrae]